jgi:hypothetical protein
LGRYISNWIFFFIIYISLVAAMKMTAERMKVRNILFVIMDWAYSNTERVYKHKANLKHLQHQCRCYLRRYL